MAQFCCFAVVNCEPGQYKMAHDAVPCMFHTPVSSFASFAPQSLAPLGRAQTWSTTLLRHSSTATTNQISSSSYLNLVKHDRSSTAPSGSDRSSTDVKKCIFDYHPQQTQRRRYISSRLSHKRPLFEEDFVHDEAENNSDNSTTSHSAPMLRRRVRDTSNNSSTSLLRSSSTRSAVATALRRAANKAEIDGYLNKIQQCMRSQSLQSRQLALSQKNRMFGGGIGETSRGKRRRVHVGDDQLMSNQERRSNSIAPSFLPPSRHLPRVGTRSLSTTSQAARSQKTAGKSQSGFSSIISSTISSTSSSASNVSQFLFDAVGNKKMQDSRKRTEKYMARLEPLMAASRRIESSGSSVMQGWGGSNSGGGKKF